MELDKGNKTQLKKEQEESFITLGVPEEKMISDVSGRINGYSLIGMQPTDDPMSYRDGMNYVVDHSSEAFWRMDKDFKFTYTNAACERVSGGFKLEDLKGRSLLEFLDPESIERFERVNGGRHRDERRGIKTDVIYHELRMRRKDGTYFWAGISATPLRDPSGYIIGYQGVLRDVSAFKKYENECKRLECLLKKNEKWIALGRMSGVIAHELNNVMAGVLGFSELLQMQIERNDQAGGEHLTNIIGLSERIIAILQDLLVLGRKEEERRQSVNLNDMIPALLQKPELKKFTGHPGGVFIHLDMEPALHDIIASATSLEKALLNLLTISFQQAGPGGCLSISTKTVYLGVGDERECNIQEGEYVVLCVADKGEGITDEDALRIFEPFYIRKVMKRKATGLELTIAREVIKEHNGFIDLRSKVGVGSIFTVYLPVLCMQNPQTRIQANRLDVLETISGVH